MCGIVGVVSNNAFSSNEALSMLKRLEYRGYDSFGVATSEGSLNKDVGFIKDSTPQECTTAVAHTRWATHGSVTKQNAHPHTDCSGSLVIVHNGIIENYLELKDNLSTHDYRSETDSEVIAHYFEEKLMVKGMHAAIIDFLNDAKGTFAIVVMKKGGDRLYAIKRDSPLVLGICKNRNILASDIYAFSDKTSKAVFFEDDEFAVISPDSYVFYNKTGSEIEKFVHEIYWPEEKNDKKYPHFMLKEIMECPDAAHRLTSSLGTTQKNKLENLVSLIKKSKRVIFVAAGTSYHASLIGVYFLHKAGVEAQTIIASEFRDYANIGSDTLVVALTQSGETMDVVDALKYAKTRGAKIVSIVNVPYSSVQRMSSTSLEILAGQEVSVAATKSFVNQVISLLAVARELGYNADLKDIKQKIKSVFDQDEEIANVARSMSESRDAYIIGRGLSYPIAREIALKLKEVSYMHAEGMMGGELKHGTLALIEQNTPVIALVANSDIMSNVMEVKARGGRIIAITNQDESKLRSVSREIIKVDAENEAEFSLLSAIAGQLLTYYIARDLGRPIDKPRNLAKSVTVK